MNAPRRYLSVLVALAALGLTAPATALAKVDGRFGVDFGSWVGAFSQEGYGQKSSLNLSPALGLQFTFGLRGSGVFLEWNPYWFFVQKLDFTDEDKSDDSWAASVGNFNLGFSFPVLPLDVYAGGGWTGFGFENGTDNDYSGPEYKLGAAFHFSGRQEAGLHVKAEYHRLFPAYDDRGTLPSQIDTTIYYFFVGIGFGPPLRGRRSLTVLRCRDCG